MGVRQLKGFNEALLGKWCWRMLVDRDELWYRVLAARYGEEDGRLEDGARSGSTWWTEVVKIRDVIGGGGNGWFSESVVRRVGDGEATLFWHDRWCGDVALRERFSKLFDLALNKSITVKDMFLHGWGEGGGGWQWRGRLWVWEEDLLAECRLLLSDVSLQPLSYDVWQWLPDPSGGYSVRGVYVMLTSQENPQVLQNTKLIWHKQIPLNVSIFAWRLLRDHLPTKSNLASRGVIDTEAYQCVSSCGQVEDARHLFLLCPCLGSLWPLVRSWMVSMVLTMLKFLTTLFSLLIIQVVRNSGDPFFSLYGFLQIGCYGIKEMLDYLNRKNAL